MINFVKKMSPIIDALTIAAVGVFVINNFAASPMQLLLIIALILLTVMTMLFIKKFYSEEKTTFQKIYALFESMAISFAIVSFISLCIGTTPLTYLLYTVTFIGAFGVILIFRGIGFILYKLFYRTKNVLIVGAGQDGKLIAEEIQQRPKLGLNVVGFLDDNMNNIEDEDSTIPILGLTCDSEAVIKDNNVKVVIIAVKSRMDSNILTDLVKGIPLGVKVWRMYRFYEKITHKFLVSKMSVNWLFYDCVRKRALFYAFVKRICDIIASLAILIVTLPLSIISIIGIELSDLGPVFFTQMRIGKFGKPFKMIKFRIMYQEEVQDFDDDVMELNADDKRIMPFCRFLRKFHIDEIPQMINVLKGDMSIVGPRPVREEVFYENKDKLPFWECRNWVHPGWCGWQQVINNEPSAEERLGLDLYYIKHRHLLWELAIFIKFIAKVIIGKGRGK